jgi:hypothetical protein
MREDIELPKVEDIAIAIIKEETDLAEPEWNVYVLNLKKQQINIVLITSKGYGEKEGEQVNTSVLRHYFENIPERSFRKIEMIKENLFGLSNEFWISFYCNGKLYDKKYVFVPETIKEENFTEIPLIGVKGVMIM